MVIPQPEPPTPWDLFKAGLPESFDDFIAYIGQGGHMAAFCGARGINYTTLLKFVGADPARGEMYARAREDRADVVADEIVAIADEIEVRVETTLTGEKILKLDQTAVQRNKLRIDARKWAASKLKPRTYGDKLELGGTVNNKSMSDAQLLERLASFGIAINSITPPPAEATDEWPRTRPWHAGAGVRPGDAHARPAPVAHRPHRRARAPPQDAPP